MTYLPSRLFPLPIAFSLISIAFLSSSFFNSFLIQIHRGFFSFILHLFTLIFSPFTGSPTCWLGILSKCDTTKWNTIVIEESSFLLISYLVGRSGDESTIALISNHANTIWSSVSGSLYYPYQVLSERTHELMSIKSKWPNLFYRQILTRQ
jgi:hypothetical protein